MIFLSEERPQGVDQLAAAVAKRSANRLRELVLKPRDDRDCPLDCVVAVWRETQGEGTRIARVIEPLHKASARELLRELGDIDRLEAAEVAQLALTGRLASARQAEE